MKIEFLEDWKEAGQSFEAGDRKSFPDEVAQRIVTAGFAKDLAGDVLTGERKGGGKSLEAQDANVSLSGGIE